MRDYLVDCIILKSVKCREADRIITIYTRQAGKKRAIAYGVEKPTSKKRGAVQPFSCSKLMLRRGGELETVSQGEGVEIFPAIRQSLQGLTVASYLAELVDVFTPDEDPNPAVFQLLLETLGGLGGDYDFAAVRAFEIKLLSLIGFQPGLDLCVMCGVPPGDGDVYFSPAQGGVVCCDCRHGAGRVLVVSRGSLENLKALMGWKIERVRRLKISPAARDEIKKMMRAFIQYRLERSMKTVNFKDLLGTDII